MPEQSLFARRRAALRADEAARARSARVVNYLVHVVNYAPGEVIPLFTALRAMLPSRDEIRDHAASFARDAVQAATDIAASETADRARELFGRYRDRWQRNRLRVDPVLARQLLAAVEEETFPGVAPLRTTVFDKAKCPFCLGLHSRKCPAVKEVEYGPNDGRIARVTFFGRWSDKDVLWREDLEEAAAREDADAA